METWEKLPTIIRWILLLPLAFLLVAVAGIIIRILVLSGGLSLSVFNLVFPPIMAVVYLYIIYLFAPSIKLKLIIGFISLRALFIPMFLVGFYLSMKGADMDMSWNEWWAPFIGEILTLITSIWLYKYLKEEYSLHDI